jgi:chromatin remodeling complex protein RSC6
MLDKRKGGQQRIPAVIPMIASHRIALNASKQKSSACNFIVAIRAGWVQNKGMATNTKSKRKPSAAFMKPVQPDEKLSKVVGSSPLPRTELTKKLWVYIRKHGLQDKKQRTLINADENLQAVFNGKKQVSMFEMTKLVSGHLD